MFLSVGVMIAGILFLLIILCAIYVGVTYNSLVKTRNIVQEAFSTMDVYLKKRWDLVPNLVETVKGYAKHEKEALTKLTSLRTGGYDQLSAEQKLDVNRQLSQGISRIMAIAENYPELKASQNFLDLNQNLARIEEDIANSRKYYNGAVRKMNNKVQMFPSNLVAAMFGFKEYSMFEMESEEKQNVKVEF